MQRGVLKAGDKCSIMGHNQHLDTVVTGVEMFKQTLDKAEAGDNCGCLLKGLKRDDIRRGQVLCKPGTATMTNQVEAQVYILSTEEGGRDRPIMTNYQPQMFCQTWDYPAYLLLKDREMIMPGEDATINVAIKTKMVVEKGLRFTLRDGSKTIGYGVISDLLEDMDMEAFEAQKKAAKKAAAKAKEAEAYA
ncbi:hypothetical protein EB796_013361 [Bugula neritina]|nr:hypothetical protein EB796_013361 [Bugula neritina]